MKLKGQKRKQLFTELILPNLPTDLQNYTYVEPFGGTFAIASYLPTRPKNLIYNDIVKYDFELETKPDLIFHTDYKSILKMYDQLDVIFYLDPPYVHKENWYGLEKSNLKFHQEIFLALCEIKNAKVLLSYEDDRLIKSLYKDIDFKIIQYSGNRQNFKKELLIVKVD